MKTSYTQDLTDLPKDVSKLTKSQLAHYIHTIQDFDAVSLYPSAMSIMYIPTGKAHNMTQD